MRYLLIVMLLVSCGGRPSPPAPSSVTTSAGIRVTSATSLSMAHLAAIDNQYDELLRIASAFPNSYEVHPAPQDIQIFIVKRDSRCREISFVITEDVPKGTNYDGTEFDLDGEINGSVEMCVAGRYHPNNGSIEVTADGIIQTDIVRYELEHWLLYRIDRDRYWKTLIHNSENIHPILGNGGLEKALASASVTR